MGVWGHWGTVGIRGFGLWLCSSGDPVQLTCSPGYLFLCPGRSLVVLRPHYPDPEDGGPGQQMSVKPMPAFGPTIATSLLAHCVLLIHCQSHV